MRLLKTVRRPPIYPKTPGHLPVAPSPTPFRCPHAVHPCPSVDSGLALAFALILLIPLVLGLASESDPQVVQETTNAIVERIVAEIPSIVVGELAACPKIA